MRGIVRLIGPWSTLQVLEVEGVAAPDAAAAPADAYEGVDYTEYYRGPDAARARVVRIVQAKYSALHAATPWTLAALTRGPKRDARRSVVGKLATAFARLAERVGGWGPDRVLVVLATNQPLDADLRRALATAQDALRAAYPPEVGRARPRAVAGPHGHAARRAAVASLRRTPWWTALRRATGLDDAAQADFLLAWDLRGFGRADLDRIERGLARSLEQVLPDGHDAMQALFGRIQQRATPGHPSRITRGSALNDLRLDARDFTPAPPVLPSARGLIATDDVARVVAAARATDGLVVVHGHGGSGKTSTLRLTLAEMAGPRAVLYDCFGGGDGPSNGNARYALDVALVQMINELDARFRTGVVATRRLRPAQLTDRFARAVRAAARAAASLGERLVLAFDAVDNAHDDGVKHAHIAGPPFLREVLHAHWPANCTVLVSLRTSRLEILDDAAAPAAPRVAVRGFGRDETVRMAKARCPGLPAAVLDRLSERTASNPRVQVGILAILAQERPEDPLAVIDRVARDDAVEFYRADAERRLVAAADRAVLALASEAVAPVQVRVLAEVGRRAVPEVRAVVRRFAYGLDVRAGDTVAWVNIDFYTWVQEHLAAERAEARAALAEYCFAHFAASPYAEAHLSRHAFFAGEDERLLAWWLDGDRLAQHLRAVAPHEERALSNVQFALRAAARRHQRGDALRLLGLAAQIAQGRDAFAESRWEHVGPAVAAGYGPTLLAELDARESWHRSTEQYLELAAAALRRSRSGGKGDAERFARRAVRRAAAVLDAEVDHARVAGRDGPSLDWSAWRALAQIWTWRDGVPASFARVADDPASRWTAFMSLAIGATAGVTAPEDAAVGGAAAPVTGTLPTAEVARSAVSRAAFALGRLAAPAGPHAGGPGGAPSNAPASEAAAAAGRDLDALVQDVERGLDGVLGLEGDFTGSVWWDALAEAAEGLAHRGARGALGRLLARIDWRWPDTWYGRAEPMLRLAALRHAFAEVAFDPATFDPNVPASRAAFPQGDANGRVADGSTAGGGTAGSGTAGANAPLADADRSPEERESRRRAAERLKEIREEMRFRYPALLVRARAWAGAPATDVAAAADAAVAHWLRDVGHRYYRPKAPYATTLRVLMEGLAACAVRVQATAGVGSPSYAAVHAAIRAAVDAAPRVTRAAADPGYAEGAAALAMYPELHAEAERVIGLARDAARPPHCPPRDGVRVRWALWEAADAVNPALAAALLEEARDLARQIDPRAGARVAALLAAGRAAAAGGGLTPDDATALVDRVAALRQIDPELDEVTLHDPLRLLAALDPELALRSAVALDDDDLIRLDEATAACTAAAVTAGRLGPAVVWPLAPLAGVGPRTLAGDNAHAWWRTVLGSPQGASASARASDGTSRGPSPARVAPHVRQQTNGMEPTGPAPGAVAAYTATVRLAGVGPTARRRAVQAGLTVLADAGAGDAEPTRGLRTYAAALDALGVSARGETEVVRSSSAGPASVGGDALRMLAAAEPLRALQRWQALDDAGRRSVDGDVVLDLARTIAPHCSSMQLRALLDGVERWDAVSHGREAVATVLAVWQGAPTRAAAAPLVAAALRNLFTPRTLAALASPYAGRTRGDAAHDALHGDWGTPDERFDVWMAAAGEHLAALGAETIYQTTARLVSLVAASDARALFAQLLAALHEGTRAVPARPDPPVLVSIPPSVLALSAAGRSETPGGLATGLGFALACLGNRDHRVRWRAAHSLAGWLAVESALVVGALADALSERGHPWWMAVREWAAFILAHAAILRPEALAGVAPTLAGAALDGEFPHFRIRAALRTALLTAEAATGAVVPAIVGALGRAALDRVRQINEPRQVTEEQAYARRRARIGAGRPRRDDDGLEAAGRAADGADSDNPEPDGGTRLLNVATFDSEAYRYERLETSFAIAPGTVRRLVARYATVTTGFTNAELDADEDRLARRGEREWRASYADRGSVPRVDTRRHYAEWHGVALAAGRLVETAPATRAGYEDWPERTAWDEWREDHAWLGDPSLPGRLVHAPPPRPENYAVFAGPVDVWCAERPADAYVGCLRHEDDADWLVVAEYREGRGDDRRYTTTVQSALVDPRRASALVLAQRGEDVPPLPRADVRESIPLHELEAAYAAHPWRRVAESDWSVAHGLYYLAPWVGSWTPSPGDGDVGRFDEWAPPHATPGATVPAPAFLDHLGLVRQAGGLSWRAADGAEVARVERWSERDVGYVTADDDRPYAEGHRLLIRRDAVWAHVAARGARLIASVRLARTPYDRTDRDGSATDLGSVMSFLLEADGSWASVGPPPSRRPRGVGGRRGPARVRRPNAHTTERKDPQPPARST